MLPIDLGDCHSKNVIPILSAIGCPDLEPPNGAWFSRNAERGVVKCNFTSQTWHLVCRDNTWVGKISNCTLESAAELESDGEMPTYGKNLDSLFVCR